MRITSIALPEKGVQIEQNILQKLNVMVYYISIYCDF